MLYYHFYTAFVKTSGRKSNPFPALTLQVDTPIMEIF